MSIQPHQVRSLVLIWIVVLGIDVAHAQSPARRVGVGVAISNAHDLLAAAATRTTEDSPAAPAIFVPIQLTNRLRLEPEIGIFRHSHEAPIDYSVNSVAAGIGILPQLVAQDFRLYYGVRVGYVRTKERVNETSSTRTQVVDGFFIAPAVGGEYMLSDRFSLGAEAQFRHTSVAGESVDTSTRVPPAFPPDIDRIENAVSVTRVLFVSRFYF